MAAHYRSSARSAPGRTSATASPVPGAKTRRDEFACRERRGDRGRDAGIAAALGNARGSRFVASARLSPRVVFGARDRAWRPRRRCRDLADAGAQTGKRQDGECARFRKCGGIDRAQLALLRTKPPLGFAWTASDLNPGGAVGEADKASAAKGTAAIDHGVDRFVALLRDVQAFDLSYLAGGPLGPAR